MPRGGFKNLPREVLSEYGRRGAQKTAEVKRKKRDIRENLKLLSEMPLKDGKKTDISKMKSIEGLKGKNMSSAEWIAIQLHRKAMQGDVPAIKLWLELTGQSVEEW